MKNIPKLDSDTTETTKGFTSRAIRGVDTMATWFAPVQQTDGGTYST
jgi:hypothetical protein